MDIGKIRRAQGFMRTVAGITLVAYLALLLPAPVQALPEAPMRPAPAKSAPAQAGLNVGEALARAREPLLALSGRRHPLGRKPSAEQRDRALAALRAWREETQALVESANAEFRATAEWIQRKNLSDLVRQRQDEARGTFTAELAALRAQVDAIVEAHEPESQQDHIHAALERLQRCACGRLQQPLDPDGLSNRLLRADPDRAPKMTEQEFQAALLLNSAPVRLAQLGGFDFSSLRGAEDPAYLAGTTEVVLTPDIRAKAEELQRDPVAIYHWVRNNVHWQPTWGALQDASHTLAAQRGNAFDIASLLIALLRAAGIPARYAYGTIEVPEHQFRNWVGGFQHINAAIDFASAGGIALTALTAGGRITKIRLEHVWVEAAIDFHPSRGAVNRAADSWLAMDGSFKQIDVLPGLDPLEIPGADAGPASLAFLASGVVNDSQGWAGGFDPVILQSAQAQVRQSLENSLPQPRASAAAVIGARRIVPLAAPVLAASLPYRVITTGARFASVPATLQQQITFAFGKDALGDLIRPRTFPWAQLNNKQITLSFRPASQVDEETLRAFLPEGEITDLSQLPAALPAYLIRVVPQLKIDGIEIMSGEALTLGAELTFVFNPRFVSAGIRPFSYRLPAGSYLAIAVVGGSINPRALHDSEQRLQLTQTKLRSNESSEGAAVPGDQVLAELFGAALLGYYAQYLTLGAVSGMRQGGHHQLAAGLGSFGYEPEVDTVFGLPRRIQGRGAVMNIPIVNIVGSDAAAGAGRREFTFQLGILSSALEHSVPEQMLTTAVQPARGMSAVRALSDANALGQKLYQITPANQAATLSQLHHDAATLEEIRAALASGKTVITHTDAVSVPGWSGVGYVILDRQTGSAAWKISGGQHGGFITGFVLGTLLFLELALLVLAFPIAAAGAPVLATLAGAEAIALLAMTLTNMLLHAFAGQDESYQQCVLLGLAAATFVVAAGMFAFPPVFAGLSSIITALGLAIEFTTMVTGDGNFLECLHL